MELQISGGGQLEIFELKKTISEGSVFLQVNSQADGDGISTWGQG